ncbi:MAG TPA: M1 family metallopeptidase [Steroidobacteraceae bacterium]|nr:M1 family metallopeptidase [Steroidobacteraceae bacterium]
MMRHCALGLMLAGSAYSATPADLAPIQSGLDYHSFANIEQYRVTRLELDLRVDSDARVLRGVVGLSVTRLDPGATQLILDTRELTVTEVTEKAQGVLGAMSKTETTWVGRPFHFERKDPILGQALVIELPPSNKPTEFIRIEYETSPTAPGLLWVAARETAGRRQSFLFTQSEPIGARSWIPLQDTPQVRVTYTATIHTSSDVLAVMSAKSDPNGLGRPVKRNGEYAFVMPDAVPSYSIALAVGDLAFKATGPRTGVYADKSVIKAAAAEFADAESMIEAAEKLFGPYRWDRFDILVMPPSFPAGGMENPRLTFVAPTVIAGDKSLVSVIAHELSHSWSGNLVTNATWRDLWLNEGFSDYLESRIMNAVYGERREMMERVLGLRSLRDDLGRLKPADQVLAIDLRDRDPDEVFSDVPYEKGRLFLTYLDAKFGHERFEAFLRGYFDHFAFKSITTEQFLKYLQENLLDRFPGVVTRDQVMAWVSGPGIPPDAVLPTSDAFAPVDEARTSWLGGKVAAKKLDTHEWVAQQWLYFLDNMPTVLTAAQMADLDQAFGFTRTANAEIGHSWFLWVIRNHYQPGYVRLEEYLKTIGRRKLIKPLYEELMKTPAGATQAKRVYALARPGYHPQTVAAIDAIVNPPSDQSETSDEQ